MSVIDTIQERIDKDLYTVSVFGSREAVYEQMWDDIESLLILFRAKSRAIEEIDNELALLEDEAHGEWGNEISKLRKKLQ